MNEIQCLFECHNLPETGAPSADCRRLGIQEGKDVVEDVPYAGQAEIHFAFTLRVETEPGSGPVVFKGKYVQGPRSEPFVYLCWGDRPDGEWVGCGRSKIPLGAIPTGQIERALQGGGPLRARISLTGRGGGPAFATLKADHVAWME